MFDTTIYIATIFTAKLAARKKISHPHYCEDDTTKSIQGMRISEIEEPAQNTGLIM